MKKGKCILSLILSVVMLFAVVSAAAEGTFAAARDAEEIREAEVTVIQPKAGTKAAKDNLPEIIVPAGAHYEVEACCWNQEDGTHAEVNDLKAYTFAAGKTYTFWVTLKANEGYVFDSSTKLTIDNAKQLGDITTYTSPDGSYSCLVTDAEVTIGQGQTGKYTLTLGSVTVKQSAKKLSLTATLKLDGKPVDGMQVTFKFNGKTYKAKTNAKGVAKVSVRKADLKKLKAGKKIKIQATAGGVTAKKTVKVKK